MSSTHASISHERQAARIDVLETMAIRSFAALASILLLIGSVIPSWSFLAERGGDDDDWHAFSLWSSMRAAFGGDSVHGNEDYWKDEFSTGAGVLALVVLVCVTIAVCLCIPIALRTMSAKTAALAKIAAVLLVLVSLVVFASHISGGEHPSRLDTPLWVYVSGAGMFVVLAFSPTLRNLANKDRRLNEM